MREQVASQGKALLNLGSGETVHPAYISVDLRPRAGTIGHDLRQGVPFPDKAYNLVYHSTMLSHFRRSEALPFMRECQRVLKPGGILRVVTEDLEQLCRLYLEKVEAAWNGDRPSGHDHEWLMLELFDQASRERSGGEMVTYLMNPELPNESFVRSRVGEQGAMMIAGAKARLINAKRPRSFSHRLKERFRKMLLTRLLGADGVKAYDIGRFRLSAGSASYLLYDRYWLRAIFQAAGLSNISLRTPESSGYHSWSAVNLDLTPSGAPARPHALIMEGVKE